MTPREQAIIDRAEAGQNAAAIADELGLSRPYVTKIINFYGGCSERPRFISDMQRANRIFLARLHAARGQAA